MGPTNPTTMHSFFKRLFSFFIFLTLAIPPAFGSTTEEDACPSSNTTEISTDLGITALYPNPNTGEEEWVELQNTDTETLDLANYTLEDATANPWTLTGNLEANETLQITGLPFQLNNSNETVTLKTIQGELVDTWTYSTSTKGEILTREVSAESTETETSTETSTQTSANPTSTPSQWPIFSEALPNPEGSDSTDEWIELYNPYGNSLELAGLKLDDMEGGSTPHSLEGTLPAESYLLLGVQESGLTLNNDADQIRLLGVNDEILWQVSYANPSEGETYAVIGSTEQWTNTPTPGAENSPGTITSETEADEETSDYQDGDLSEEVALTEVFPNPEGPDNEEEWIELTNGGSEAVNLGNWTLTDASGKTYTFPDSTFIQAGETLVLYRTESDISLNNSNESLSLADFTGEVLSEVSFDSSEEDQAYAQIQVEEVESTQASTLALGNPIHTLWQWVTPTPGEQNPIWKQIKGTVSEYDGSLLTLFDGISSWTFTVTQDSTSTLLYTVGNVLLVQASLQNELYQVMHAELLESAEVKEKNKFPWTLILSILGLSTWGAYEAWKHRRKILNFEQMAVN